MAIGRKATTVVFALGLAALGSAVQPQELQDWFASQDGLAMPVSDAQALAYKSWQALTQCGVTVKNLQALKDALYDHSGIDLDLVTLRQNILLLAEQHVNPDKVSQFYNALSSSYTISGGLALAKPDAQRRTLQLLKARAEVDQLYDLYKVMYGYQGIGFDQRTAQETALQQATAGADAQSFKTTYLKSKALGKTQQQATQDAVTQSINDNLFGLVRRYAKDATPYTANEFQTYYAASWLGEWLAAPMEMRVSGDRVEHTAGQYKRHYPSDWAARYRSDPEAIQMRLAADGKSYSIVEYKNYYGNTWQSLWADSPELPCSQCAPFAAKVAAAAQVVV